MMAADSPWSYGLLHAMPHSRNPEDLTTFRLGQLLLLLCTIAERSARPPNMERLGYYDFFAANPFVIFREDSPERRSLKLAGLSSKALSYASAGQRWTTRRERLQHDVALLVAHGLAQRRLEGRVVGYIATPEGQEIVDQLKSLYSRAFRRSAELVIDSLKGLSDTRLTAYAEDALRTSPLLIDIYGDEMDPALARGGADSDAG